MTISLSRLSSLAIELETALQIAQLTPSSQRVDNLYFRNTTHVLSNLHLALKKFAETHDLNAQFPATSGQGQTAFQQPDKVSETFKNAVDPNYYGGIQQTLQKISEKPVMPQDTVVAQKVREILAFLQTNHLVD
jgi:hypothetical protein